MIKAIKISDTSPLSAFLVRIPLPIVVSYYID
jgi:hypothetical protein